jgi:hypothetical protein
MTRPFEGEDNEGECNGNFGGRKSLASIPAAAERRQKAEELAATIFRSPLASRLRTVVK